ncbi:GAF domain-containing protein [Megalodesulfovibrio paquesii]
MSKIKLKRLLGQRRVASLLEDLATRLGLPLCIQDAQGKPVLMAPAPGAAPLTERQPIEVDGDVAGYVLHEQGDENAPILGRLVATLGMLDLEKRTLAHDTLCRYNELTLLYDMAARAASLQGEDAAAELVRAIRGAIPCDHVGVLLCWTGESPRLLHPLPDTAFLETVCREVAGIHAAVRQSGRAEIINELATDSRAGGATALSSMLCVPLRCAGEVFGLVHVGSCTPRLYTTEQLSLLSTLSFQVAAVMENRRLRRRQEQSRQGLLAVAQALEQALSDGTNDPGEDA